MGLGVKPKPRGFYAHTHFWIWGVYPHSKVGVGTEFAPKRRLGFYTHPLLDMSCIPTFKSGGGYITHVRKGVRVWNLHPEGSMPIPTF